MLSADHLTARRHAAEVQQRLSYKTARCGRPAAEVCETTEALFKMAAALLKGLDLLTRAPGSATSPRRPRGPGRGL